MARNRIHPFAWSEWGPREAGPKGEPQGGGAPFQPGLSLPAFLQQYGTEEACEAALELARWPEGCVCPRCGGRAHSQFRHRGVRMWQCSACHRQTRLRSGTLFAHSKLPLTTWFLALYLLTQTKTHLATLELARHLGLCYGSAWRLTKSPGAILNRRRRARRGKYREVFPNHKLMQACDPNAKPRAVWRGWCRSTMPTGAASAMAASPGVA